MFFFFFFNDTATTEIYTLSLHDALPISPKLLDEILSYSKTNFIDTNLLVGNELKDDAAVYDLGNGEALISTADFFMPIVDDPFTFGRIAGCNAISDIYAMGGEPLMAIAIFGWPIDKLPASVAAEVIEGGRSICAEAGIVLAGGHSIDSPEPIFGLSVSGRVSLRYLKKNSDAKAGDAIFITKPLGVGILATAQKMKKVHFDDHQNAIRSEEHTSELQSRRNLVCRLLLEKK